MLALSSMTAHGQAMDSTGLDKLSGVSGRVDNLIPPAIPGPAGPAGPTGATGSAATVPQGTMCGLSNVITTTSTGGGNGLSESKPKLAVTCQGYPVFDWVRNYRGNGRYYMGNFDTVSNCPSGYTAYEISMSSSNNGQEGSTNSSTIVTAYSCIKG